VLHAPAAEKDQVSPAETLPMPTSRSPDGIRISCPASRGSAQSIPPGSAIGSFAVVRLRCDARALVITPTAQDESSFQPSHTEVASMGQFGEARMRFAAYRPIRQSRRIRAHSSPYAASTLAIAGIPSTGQPRFRRVDRRG
jgi:hypothetical protein